MDSVIVLLQAVVNSPGCWLAKILSLWTLYHASAFFMDCPGPTYCVFLPGLCFSKGSSVYIFLCTGIGYKKGQHVQTWSFSFTQTACSSLLRLIQELAK